MKILLSCVSFAWMACLLGSMSAIHAAEAVSLTSLLNEMISRESLARFPRPSYTCRQFSSYDRGSTDPADQEGWFANFDRSYFLRTEERAGTDKKEYVMMDADGPGAIVRVWGTWHGPQGQPFSNGTLCVYLDRQQEPAIEGPIQEIIDGGKLVGPPLGQGVSPKTGYNQRGHNLYLPIPYAKHCKVTYSTNVLMDEGARRGEALYYHINYRTYQPGTNVETFSMQQLTQAKSKLDEVQQLLAAGQRPASNGWKQESKTGMLRPQTESESVILSGPGAVRQIQLKLIAEDLSQALRSTILKIEFDGEQTVWCPVGEFFGTGYKMSPYQSWYTQVTENGLMSCDWVMPFERQAKLSLVNVGEQSVEVAVGNVSSSDWNWNDRSLHFNATWRELHNIDTRRGSEEPGAGAYDVNYVTVEGKGIYVGDTLSVHNGAPAWWGEGDEKIYVDGESFPSHFGTGTEDYYGYAWCRPESFSAPFHAQPEGRGNMRGGFSVNSRYRALDAIPFEKSIRFDMEQWHWADTKMDFAPTTFFYARPVAQVNVEPDPGAAARPVNTSVPELPKAVKVEGAIEGESLNVIRHTGGSISRQHAPQYRWSEDEQLWWQGGAPGDVMVVSFPVDNAGKYKVVANLTKASDYANVEVAVNDGQFSNPIARYHGTVAHDPIELGTYLMKKGENRLTFRLAGHDDRAIKRGMVGIDYLKLEPAAH